MKQREYSINKSLSPTKVVFLAKVAQLKKKYLRHYFHARKTRASETWKANKKRKYLYKG